MEYFNNNGNVYDKGLAKRIALRFYLFTAVIVVVIAVSVYFFDKSRSLDNWLISEKNHVDIVSQTMDNQVRESISKFLILSGLNEWYLENPAANKALAKAFVNTVIVEPNFYQLRFIDKQGMEIVRVNNINNSPVIVKQNELQNKSSRYYFTKGMQLKQGEVYVSPLDLNVEHGEIEKPLRPIIRLVTPAIDPSGRMHGVLVANLQTDSIFNILKLHDSDSKAELMLLNSDGFWLYSREEGKRWGFQLIHSNSFAKEYPDDWINVLKSPQGQSKNSRGLFTHKTISNISETLTRQSAIFAKGKFSYSIVESPVWHLVSFANNQVLFENTNKRGRFTLVLVILALIMLIPFSRVWAVRSAQNTYSREQVRTYATLIEQSNELVYVVSRKGKIMFANPAVEKTYGYSQHEIIGQSPSIFKSGRHPDEFYKLLWKTICNNKPFNGVFVNKKKNGSIFYESKHIIPIELGHNKETVYVSWGHDLTEISKKKIQNMNTSNRVSASIQHHFNNLLMTIKGYLELAIINMKEKDNDKAMDMLVMSMESAVTTEELIAKIAHSSANRHEELESQHIEGIIQAAVDKMKQEIPGNINFIVKVENDLPVIKSNSVLLQSALEEVLKNASSVIPGSGNIDLDVELMKPVNEFCFNCNEPINGQQISISVTDTGMGIAPESLQDIFEPFYTTKESAQLVGKTPGLGLTLVRSIIHMHGGHILLESDSNGTTIRMLIPVESVE